MWAPLEITPHHSVGTIKQTKSQLIYALMCTWHYASGIKLKVSSIWELSKPIVNKCNIGFELYCILDINTCIWPCLGVVWYYVICITYTITLTLYIKMSSTRVSESIIIMSIAFIHSRHSSLSICKQQHYMIGLSTITASKNIPFTVMPCKDRRMIRWV